MPVLTKNQVLEAAFELLPEERTEVWEQIAEKDRPLHLTEEQKAIILAELAEHDRDPNGGTSWEDLRAELQAQVIR
ncbi:MAG TPA: hypothetical protein VF627_06465 [Abditibacterium sp.]|jgi:putative addiction module component (TIGR02574 family)